MTERVKIRYVDQDNFVDKITKTKSLPSRDEFAERLVKTKDPYSYSETKIAGLDPNMLEQVPVQIFTDIETMYANDMHMVLYGRSGQGKTTLQLTLLRNFMLKGFKVLFRDDGGLEFAYLARYFKTQVFIPDDQNISLTPRGLSPYVNRTNDVNQILEDSFNGDYPFNVIVYDAFCENPSQSATFFSDVFLKIIHRAQQTPMSKKQDIIFSIDELNDLVSPRGRGLTREHETVRSLIEYNVRKLRKHKIRMICSSHRPNQLPINVRSQFEHTFIKRSYGYDVWDFCSKNLVTSNNKTFWSVLRKLTNMPRNEFCYFDENGKFDFYTFRDVPREGELEALGTIGSIEEEKKDNKIKRSRAEAMIQLAVLRASGKKLRDCVPIMGKSEAYLSNLWYAIINELDLKPEVQQALKKKGENEENA